ncbi:helix-turn-helix domain-containing protein [Streptomyces sp. NPDC058655]|uniref:helix-turn-helix domain-containing protein n=1 Tax=Streptomyces sp. NPDC058655 TaxID=3346577 RepID=UPI00364AD8E6
MAVNENPTIRRIRLGAELRRLRLARGLTGVQVAEQLMVSQPKISLIETGRRAISPRDVRDLCGLYGVADQQVVDGLIRMARESGRRGWWGAYGEVPCSVYIGLEMEASAISSYEPMVVPGLLQTPAYATAVIAGMIPEPTSEQVAAGVEVRMRRQHRAHHPARPFRLWVVLDEAVLRRVVGSPDIMREQLEHLNRLGAQPHISVQVLPHDAGAHPGLSGQFSVLHFADTPGTGTVHLERLTSDLYLQNRWEVRSFSVLYDRLRSQALDPERTERLITRTARAYAG